MYEEIGGGADVISINGRDMSLRAYCSQFNFKGSDQQASLLGGLVAKHTHQLSLICTAASETAVAAPGWARRMSQDSRT